MFYDFVRIILAGMCAVCYVILTVKIFNKRKVEKKEEVTVYPGKYYTRLTFDLIGDGCVLAFIFSLLTAIVNRGEYTMDWWCPMYAAAAKYLNYKNNF